MTTSLNYTKIKASDLKPGDAFRIPGKRNFLLVKSIDTLSIEKGDRMPKQFEGKLLIVLHDCKTMTIDPEQKIEKR